MALIECSECGQEISNLANSCPNCGFPLNAKQLNNIRQKIIIVIVLIIILTVLSWVYILPKILTKMEIIPSENNSSNTLQQVLPDSDAIRTVKKGILSEYPQITVSEAFDHYYFFNKTRWYEVGIVNGKKSVAVECSLDKEKLESVITDTQRDSFQNLLHQKLKDPKIANEKLVFYFLINSNNTFEYMGHDECVTINNEATCIGVVGGEKGIAFFDTYIYGYPLDLIYKNDEGKFYSLHYDAIIDKYLKKHPESTIPTFSYSPLINDEDYKSLKKISSRFSEVDQKMIQTYNKLYSSLSDDAKILLSDDQQQWINTRNVEAIQFGKKGTPEYINKLIQLTERRTHELQAQL